MSVIRLATVAHDLVSVLAAATGGQLQRVSRAVVEWVFQSVQVADPRVAPARAALEAGDFGASALRSEILGLVEELDGAAWDIQDADDQRYLDAFARARAVNSLWYALAGPEPESVMECAYEAQAARGDTTGLQDVVLAAMRGDAAPNHTRKVR